MAKTPAISKEPSSGGDTIRTTVPGCADITKSRQLEEELQEAKWFSDAIIDIAHVMILVLDHDGRIVRFNKSAEQITGYTASEIMGKTIWDVLIPEKDKRRFVKGMRALEFRDPPTQVESFIRVKDGSLRLVLWSSRAIRDDLGRVKWVVGTGVDITEQKALQDQLQRADKMRAMGELAVGIAHDFNNIVTGIRGHIHLLQMRIDKGVATNEEIYTALKKMERSTTRARELVGQILKFVRGTPSKLEDVDLNRLVKEVVLVLEPYLKRAEVALNLELSKEVPFVTGDPGRLQQVILNLAVNAIQACSRDGKVTIRTGTKPCLVGPLGICALIEVEDTGSGIDPELKDRIFEPYFTTKTEIKEGSGLGLFVVYNIVKLHKGKIDVWSELNRGSRFSVYLPLTRTEYEGRKRPPEEILLAKGRAEGCLTVLTIDDDVALRDLLTEGLALLGHRAITAASGKEALELYHRHAQEIHLVIIDRFMPDISGEELLDELHKINPRLKAVIMSGYLPDADDLRKLPGIIDILQKPFSIYDLKTLLTQCLADYGQ